MHVISRTSLVYHVVLASILAGTTAVVGAASIRSGWWLGPVVFLLVLAALLRKALRRMRAIRNELPAEAREWMEEKVALYRNLGREECERFERDVKIVLAEWTFEGVGGVEVTDRLKIAVAAGAALLLHGRPDWELPSRQTVLFYPERFDSDYLADDSAHFDGMAHQQGPIILSVQAMEESWADSSDGSNVVLHELAHLLDYENEFADGVPSLVDPGSAVAWQELVRKEMRRIRIGRSLLRRYGAKDPAEFFAVAVENFFERPDALQGRHPELFAALKALFNLDPRTTTPVFGEGATADE